MNKWSQNGKVLGGLSDTAWKATTSTLLPCLLWRKKDKPNKHCACQKCNIRVIWNIAISGIQSCCSSYPLWSLLNAVVVVLTHHLSIPLSTWISINSRRSGITRICLEPYNKSTKSVWGGLKEMRGRGKNKCWNCISCNEETRKYRWSFFVAVGHREKQKEGG